MGAKDKPEGPQNKTLPANSCRTNSLYNVAKRSAAFIWPYVSTPTCYAGRKAWNGASYVVSGTITTAKGAYNGGKDGGRKAWNGASYVVSGTITTAKGAYNGGKDGANRGGKYGEKLGTEHGPSVGGKIGRKLMAFVTSKLLWIPVLEDCGEELGRQAGEKTGSTIGWTTGAAFGILYGVVEKAVKEINKRRSPDGDTFRKLPAGESTKD